MILLKLENQHVIVEWFQISLENSWEHVLRLRVHTDGLLLQKQNLERICGEIRTAASGTQSTQSWVEFVVCFESWEKKRKDWKLMGGMD